MTVQRVPIGFRLGVSHYWELPFYKLKSVAFSYALLKYLKLLILSCFICLKKNWLLYKKGSVKVKEFFVKVNFHFWETSKINILVSFVGKAKYTKSGYLLQTFESYLGAKKSLDSRFVKLRLMLNESLHDPLFVPTKEEYYSPLHWFSRSNNRLKEKSKISLKDPMKFFFYSCLYNLVNVYYQYSYNLGRSKYKKFISSLYYLNCIILKPQIAASTLALVRIISMLDISNGQWSTLRYYIFQSIFSSISEYLRRLFSYKVVNVSLNTGWPLVRYLYFCYILYSCYFKRFALEKNLTRYYHFYSRAVLGFYLQELSIVFRYFQQKFSHKRLKNIRFTNKIFFNFIKKLKVLPFKHFGIFTVNVQFKGRAWAKKKKWAKTKKVSIVGPGNPLSTLCITYIYIAKHFNTKFGTYGLKIWMSFSGEVLKQNLIDFLNSDALDSPGQIRFITKEISWVSI